MPPLVKVHKRFIDVAVFLRERYLVAVQIVGHLQMTARALKLADMTGDQTRSDKSVSEQPAGQPAKRIRFVND